MRTENISPTKGNLMNVKKSLQLARMGFDLLDRKRNILIRELMTMIDSAKKLRGQISSTYAKAYIALSGPTSPWGSSRGSQTASPSKTVWRSSTAASWVPNCPPSVWTPPRIRK